MGPVRLGAAKIIPQSADDDKGPSAAALKREAMGTGGTKPVVVPRLNTTIDTWPRVGEGKAGLGNLTGPSTSHTLLSASGDSMTAAQWAPSHRELPSLIRNGDGSDGTASPLFRSAAETAAEARWAARAAREADGPGSLAAQAARTTGKARAVAGLVGALEGLSSRLSSRRSGKATGDASGGALALRVKGGATAISKILGGSESRDARDQPGMPSNLSAVDKGISEVLLEERRPLGDGWGPRSLLEAMEVRALPPLLQESSMSVDPNANGLPSGMKSGSDALLADSGVTVAARHALNDSPVTSQHSSVMVHGPFVHLSRGEAQRGLPGSEPRPSLQPIMEPGESPGMANPRPITDSPSNSSRPHPSSGISLLPPPLPLVYLQHSIEDEARRQNVAFSAILNSARKRHPQPPVPSALAKNTGSEEIERGGVISTTIDHAPASPGSTRPTVVHRSCHEGFVDMELRFESDGGASTASLRHNTTPEAAGAGNRGLVKEGRPHRALHDGVEHSDSALEPTVIFDLPSLGQRGEDDLSLRQLAVLGGLQTGGTSSISGVRWGEGGGGGLVSLGGTGGGHETAALDSYNDGPGEVADAYSSTTLLLHKLKQMRSPKRGAASEESPFIGGEDAVPLAMQGGGGVVAAAGGGHHHDDQNSVDGLGLADSFDAGQTRSFGLSGDSLNPSHGSHDRWPGGDDSHPLDSAYLTSGDASFADEEQQQHVPGLHPPVLPSDVISAMAEVKRILQSLGRNDDDAIEPIKRPEDVGEEAFREKADFLGQDLPDGGTPQNLLHTELAGGAGETGERGPPEEGKRDEKGPQYRPSPQRQSLLRQSQPHPLFGTLPPGSSPEKGGDLLDSHIADLAQVEGLLARLSDIGGGIPESSSPPRQGGDGRIIAPLEIIQPSGDDHTSVCSRALPVPAFVAELPDPAKREVFNSKIGQHTPVTFNQRTESSVAVTSQPLSSASGNWEPREAQLPGDQRGLAIDERDLRRDQKAPRGDEELADLFRRIESLYGEGHSATKGSRGKGSQGGELLAICVVVILHCFILSWMIAYLTLLTFILTYPTIDVEVQARM